MLTRPICPLKRFQELDESPPVILVESRLFLEKLSTEVVPLVDDKIWAFTELQQIRHQMQVWVREYLGRLLIAPSFDFLQRFFHLEQYAGQFHFVLFEVEIGKQIDRRSLGNRTDLDRPVSEKPGKELLEPLTPTEQLSETFGKVRKRNFYVGPRRGSIDKARYVEGFRLGQT